MGATSWSWTSRSTFDRKLLNSESAPQSVKCSFRSSGAIHLWRPRELISICVRVRIGECPFSRFIV
jgi:hypothetical protein